MNDQAHLPPNAMILVTGATGFVGAYVVRDLIRSGYRVRAMRRRNILPSYIDKDVLEKVEWVEGDILNVAGVEELMEGIDGIIHAAAKVSFNPRDSQDLFRVNVEGTANMINLAVEFGVKKFVHVSSVSAIGRSRADTSINESGKWQNSKQQSNYGVSKYEAEMEVWRGIAEGLDALIVNPSTILGYGNWNESSCALFKNIYKGFPWFSDGMNGFVGVEDVSRIIVDLLGSDITAERFIVSAENRTYHEVFNAIAGGLNKRRPYRKATPFLSALAWRAEKIRALFTGSPPLVTKETARVALSNNVYENAKILAALDNFSFTPISQVVGEACEKYLAEVQSSPRNQ